MVNKTGKVAIIGSGFVGATAAYAILVKGVAKEIVLVDISKDKAEGEAMDLEHGLRFVKNSKITFSDKFDAVAGAQIIVISAGAHQKPGETRLDLVRKNAAIFKEMIPKIVSHNRDAIFLIISNPVDILTYLTIKYSGLPKSQVFGSGTSLDTARLRYLLSTHYKIDVNNIHAYMLGEHGDSEFPAWSTANIAGIPLWQFEGFDQSLLDKMFHDTKSAAYEIIAKKGATYYAIGLVIADICQAMLTDSNRILPLSTYLEDYHGANDVCLSVPCILNSDGIKRQVLLPFSDKEKHDLHHSADTLKAIIEQIGEKMVLERMA